MIFTKESIIGKTLVLKSPLAPLCQRGVTPPFGIFPLLKAGKGRVGGILSINVVIIWTD